MTDLSITPEIVDLGASPVAITAGEQRQIRLLAGAFVAGYSIESTRRSYSADLRFWLSYLEELGIHPLKVHRSHLEVWMRMMEARGLAPATVFRRAGTICTFYHWLVSEDVLVKNPVSAARRPKVQKYSPREAFTRLEVHRWMKEAEKEGGYVFALAALLAFNGFRIAETCALNVEDITKDGYTYMVTVHRKGGRTERHTPPPLTLHAIDLALDGRTTGPLLLTRYGTRMNREAAGRIVARLTKKIGSSKHITPHSLRHTAVTLLLDSGASIRDVADFAGHVDIKTTSFYDRNRNSPHRHLSYAAMQYIGGAG